MTSARDKPRIVLVTRKTSFQLLIELHGTADAARFFLRTNGKSIDPHAAYHEREEAAIAAVYASLDPQRRRTRIDRFELDRFLFAPDDLIVIVGQDGLVANVARFLGGQKVIGVNPDASRFDGVLCSFAPDQFSEVLSWADTPGNSGFIVQQRTMVEAIRGDGARLVGLNELFVGHRSHQSARYVLRTHESEERQSSSGIICSTGTGATGWARSVVLQRRIRSDLPSPEDRRLVWFVREPFPSVFTETDLDFGFIGAGDQLQITSEMSEGGTIFADGIEHDFLRFSEGQSLNVGLATQTLNLVAPAIRLAAPGTPEADVAESPKRRKRPHARQTR